MNAADLAVDVLLGLAVAGYLVCVAGVLAMRTVYDRLHYSGAATTVPSLLLLAAVLVRVHVSSGGLEAIATVAILFLLGPALVIATARAARRIDYGSVTPLPEERGREP